MNGLPAVETMRSVLLGLFNVPDWLRSDTPRGHSPKWHAGRRRRAGQRKERRARKAFERLQQAQQNDPLAHIHPARYRTVGRHGR